MGLLKTGVKAAVAVKTADVIHQRILDRQQEHATVQGHPVPPPGVAQPAPAAVTSAVPAQASMTMADKLAQLKQLGELQQSGVLTEAEFEAQKAQILSA